ncbi:MAG: hypothetical protein JF589_10000 [Gemmatimonadetes bacterium]|nr:hypothetical protein [Gemmatimonadota bacterium]
MTLAAEAEGLTPSANQEPKSSALLRLIAGVGGLAVLTGAALMSFGTVVIVLIGMAVVAGVQRKRGRALTRSGHWVAACATMAVVLLAISGALFAYVPRGAMDAAKQSMDSSSAVAAKRPAPAWVQRLYPQYAQQAAANTKPSPAMVWASMIIGIGIAVAFFATLLGTLSWGAGMLLGLAFFGRWPGAKGESFENLAVPIA